MRERQGAKGCSRASVPLALKECQGLLATTNNEEREKEQGGGSKSNSCVFLLTFFFLFFPFLALLRARMVDLAIEKKKKMGGGV